MGDHDPVRRAFVVAAVTAGAAVATSVMAQTQTDVGPRVLDGQPVPEPGPDKSSAPVRPGRGSSLSGKVAVVAGAARGIGRAIAVEMAANGADVIAVDIVAPISTASDAVPATPEELNETVRQIQGCGRRGEAVRADIRDTYGALHWFAEALKVGDVPGLDVPGIDFLFLAKGYGVEGVRAAPADDLKQALTAALGSQAPTLIEVPTLANSLGA